MPLDTELHKSAHKGDVQGVRDLVESGEVDVNEKGAQDRTALHRAAGANHVGIVQFLLQAGAPVDCIDRCRRTPLHWAAISGHLDATQLLLDNGGSLRCKTMSGMNPLMCAVQQRWHSVAEAILEWSAGSSGEDGDDQTPSPAELCSTTDAEGKTAIMFAKENGDVSMQKLLKAYAPKKPSSSCCGSARKGQLAAVSNPNEGGVKTAGGDGIGDGGGRFRCFARLCGTSAGESLNGSPQGTTARDSSPSNSATAAGVSGGKVVECRGSVATEGDTVRSSGTTNASACANNNMGTNLPRPVSGEAVNTRSGTDSIGTLVMNSPASDNAKRLSNSARSALPPVENAPLRDPNPVPKDKRGSNGSVNGSGQALSAGSGSGGGRKRREGHGVSSERRSSSSSRKSKAADSTGDQARRNKKGETEDRVG